MRTFGALMLGALLVEIIGYLWHRFAEHKGIFGRIIRHRHWVHHEVHYPPESLRPPELPKYKSVHPWSWWIVGVVSVVGVFICFPLRDAVTATVGGFLYGWFTVKIHETFHVPNHWLSRYAWFRRLVKLHDIHHWGPYNYGITFFWMDKLFGTLREEFPAEKEQGF